MNAVAQPSDGQIDVVVAFGRCIIDESGEQRLAGETARVPACDLPMLLNQGFVCDPADKLAQDNTTNSAEATRIANNLGRLVQQHLTAVAFGLRPNQDGALQRAQQFLQSLDALHKQGEQLVSALTHGGDGQPA